MNIRPTDEEMGEIVHEWFLDADDMLQNQFKNTKESHLWEYQHALGQSIRNHFDLWKYEWVPDIQDSVDRSEEHPDEISMRVIKLVWEKVQ